MATLFNVNDNETKSNILEKLRKEIQSASINFLIGAGCTAAAIPVLGTIEDDVQKRIDEHKENEAEILIFEYLQPFLEVSNKLISTSDPGTKVTIDIFKSLLDNISEILFARKSNIQPKRATIFSTNYDLFIERAFEEIKTPINLSDGFKRGPSVTGSSIFSPSEFFNSTFNSGNLYSYSVEIPSINLVKLHGSLSWQGNGGDIVFSIHHLEDLLSEHKKISKKKKPKEIKEFNNKFYVVFPKKDKFKSTLLNQTYYDLLRLFANELDKQNTLLITEGFSFRDEHILEITKRALKNPTLMIVVFSYSKKDSEHYSQIFAPYNNVDVVYPEIGNISFDDFNTTLKNIKQ
jgi:hypothetical protein